MKNTTLCYIENPAGEYLMLHRVKKENDCNHDKWIGVGGKFEDGESPEECVLRETLEELVVYRALYGDGGLWVRPASMWTETVERDGYHGPRFIWVAER